MYTTVKRHQCRRNGFVERQHGNKQIQIMNELLHCIKKLYRRVVTYNRIKSFAVTLLLLKEEKMYH